MRYLIQHIWICLVIAAIIGGIIGWLLRHWSCKRHLAALEHRLRNSAAQPIAQAGALHAATTIIREMDPYPVEDIEGIGKGWGSSLRNMGIDTTADLLERCCTTSGQQSIAAAMAVEPVAVRSWAGMADLMRVPGVRGQEAELLFWSGTTDTDALGRADPATFRDKLAQINEEQRRVPMVPDLSTVGEWIAAQKVFRRRCKITKTRRCK